MLFLTVCLLIILTLVSYVLFDKDIFAPPTVVSLGLLFSALCAFYNEKKWALEYSSNTMWIIFIGVASFIIGGVLAVVFANICRLSRIRFNHNSSHVKQIYIDIPKTIIIIVFQLLTAVMLFLQLRRITGASSWTNMIAIYRSLTGWQQDLDDMSIIFPWLLRQFLEMNFAVGLVYVYIVGNNLVACKKQSKMNWIPIVLCVIITLMQGYRSDMLRLWIALLIITYTLKKRSVGWASSREIKKMVKVMAYSIVCIAVLFVILRGAVGRTETDWDPLFYLTHYAGSPVAALDLFLKEPSAPSNIWGKETFYNLNQIISAWFNKPERRYIFYKEFRSSPNGYIIGNVYTALRPPYYDFGGVKGVIVYMLIMGTFFTFFYCKIRDRHGENEIDFRLLIYSHIAYTFFMYFYNLYNNFVSFGYFKFIVELLLVRWFLVSWHLKKRGYIVFPRNRRVAFKHSG